MEHRLDLTGTRSILSNLEEYRIAVAEIATRANRTLSIYTTDLEPLIYDHDLFLEPVKRLVLARSHARLRVLISNPGRVSREGNRFMMMARRLPVTSTCATSRPSTAATPARSSWPTTATHRVPAAGVDVDGIVEFNDVSVVKRYLAYFDEVGPGSLVAA